MADHTQQKKKESRGRVIAVTSGKGGVGKTSIAVNLSIILARAGLRVLLIDADLGLANVDLMTGVTAPHTIEEVIGGSASIFDALAEGPENVTVLPASSGLGEIGEFADRGMLFRRELIKLENAFDIIFIDTGAGISANVVDFVFMADEVLVVMTPEPTAFADAYAMVKLVSRENPDIMVGVVVNTVAREEDGSRLYEKFAQITKRFLHRKVINRGSVVRDKAVGEAVMRQVPLALMAGKSPAMQSLNAVARSILGMKNTKSKSMFSR